MFREIQHLKRVILLPRTNQHGFRNEIERQESFRNNCIHLITDLKARLSRGLLRSAEDMAVGIIMSVEIYEGGLGSYPKLDIWAPTVTKVSLSLVFLDGLEINLSKVEANSRLGTCCVVLFPEKEMRIFHPGLHALFSSRRVPSPEPALG